MISVLCRYTRRGGDGGASQAVRGFWCGDCADHSTGEEGGGCLHGHPGGPLQGWVRNALSS